jgi:hypothetical protein
LAACLTLLTAGGALACESEPGCRAARYRAAAAYFSSENRCDLYDSTFQCREASYAGLQQALSRADTARGCNVAADIQFITDAVGEVRGFFELRRLLGFPDRRLRCSRARWRGASQYARNLLQAHARNAIRPDAARLARAIARLQTELGRALANGLAAGDCDGGVDATVEAVAAALRRMIEEICAICGSGVRGGEEQCDGADALAQGSAPPTVPVRRADSAATTRSSRGRNATAAMRPPAPASPASRNARRPAGPTSVAARRNR